MIVFTHEHSYHLLVHYMARRDAEEAPYTSTSSTQQPSSTTLHHFLPLVCL
jgi:hypothetical protein